MIRPLYYYGHPVLRQKCESVKEITDEIRQLVADMVETLNHENGAGLAAPQVGVPIRLFILRDYIVAEDGHWTMTDPPTVYINPKILSPSQETDIDTEGCLSIPGVRGKVERPWRIKVEAMDLDGNIFTQEIEGYNARCRMHENDHLNGVLYIDRMDAKSKQKLESALREIKKKYNP